MKILCFSDSHGRFDLPDIEMDALFLLGDIEYYELREIDKQFSCPKFGVLGNHDGMDYYNNTSIVNVQETIVEWNGLKIAGFGGCPRYNNRPYLQYYDEELHDFMHCLPSVDIFLAHSNPQWIPDNDETNPHRGFPSFTQYIHDKQPSYFLHGHIHDPYTKKINHTNVISVYPHYLLEI